MPASSFFTESSEYERTLYIQHLQAITLLSRLFSESCKPYLHYRIHERIFCKVFDALDLSRNDIAIDCGKGAFGIGLKTFIDSNRQKIAEFNRQANELRELSPLCIAQKVAQWRNERLAFARQLRVASPYEHLLYHYVYRKAGKLFILEEEMSSIDIDAISLTRGTHVNVITFNDRSTGHSYSFNKSKSTLYHDFDLQHCLYQADITIHEDPFTLILQLLRDSEINTGILRLAGESVSLIADVIEVDLVKDQEEVLLPLYSKRNGEKYVPTRSGLNQWNAGGRPRGLGEVYIPIPRSFYMKAPDFFPSRDEIFTLILPSGNSMVAKICQDGGKALMSNPNNALGEWLLRGLLKKGEGELVTYSDFENVGVDSIALNKQPDGNYMLSFRELDAYEHFMALIQI